MTRLFQRFMGPCLAAALCLTSATGCFGGPPRGEPVTSIERISTLPTDNLPVHAPVTLRWTDNMVPFIDAQDDRDVPLVMGLVHAHLRLGQMELMRRLAAGRLSEMAGPFALDVDHTIRAIDLPRASHLTVQTMRSDVRDWVDRYVEGVNLYIERCPQWPPELKMLGVKPEPWTAEDIVTLGRLASADVNWLFWWAWLRVREDDNAAEWWDRMMAFGGAGLPSFGSENPMALLAAPAKSGSNCFAVAGSRTHSGSAILASDPHVGFALPAQWVIVGYRSPSSHVLGLTMPGLPVVVIGRNDRIAWGATNMQALSSTLYDVSDLSEDQVTERIEVVKRRWLGSSRIRIRETAYGPIISDAPLIKDDAKADIALRWRGHEPSGEFQAFLDASRASCWQEFRRAFEPYAVSGQNVIYADAEGHIGQLLAVEFAPEAGAAAMAGLGDPSNPDHIWGKPLLSTDLPAAFGPDSSYLISCNNVPVYTDPPITLIANGDDRYRRIAALIESAGLHSVATMADIQTDVLSPVGLETAQEIVARCASLDIDAGGARILDLLRDWDGRYTVESQGAAAYQAVLARLVKSAYGKRYGADIAGTMCSSPAVQSLILEDLRSGSLDKFLPRALTRACVDAPEGRTWGDVHHLRLNHWIGAVPVLGSSFRFGEIPIPGSCSTIFKSAHTIGASKHQATFGATARFVTDLSSPDDNHFVIMGGQDGWLGSDSFDDLIPLWREGRLVQIPFSPAGVARTFHRVQSLLPSPLN